MANCVCGHLISLVDHFCRECGAPSSGVVLPAAEVSSQYVQSTNATGSSDNRHLGDQASTDGVTEPMLLTTLAGNGEQTAEVGRQVVVAKGGQFGLWLGGALALSAFAWFLFGSSGGDDAQVAEPPLATQLADDGDNGSEKTGRSIADDRASDDPESDQQAHRNKWLLEMVDFDLVYGVAGERAVLLDLSTGDQTRIGPPGSHPVAVKDRKVVLGIPTQTGEPATFGIIDLDDEDAEMVVINRDASERLSFLDAGDRLRFLRFEPVDGSVDPENYVWDIEVDLVEYSYEGRKLLERPTSNRPIPPHNLLNETSQILQNRGNGYKAQVDGHVIAAGPDIALVQDCGDSGCESTWYSTETWKPTFYPRVSLPFVSDGLNIPEVVSGRWLLDIRALPPEDGLPGGIEVHVIDIVSGQEVRTAEIDPFYVGYTYQWVRPAIGSTRLQHWLLDTSDPEAQVIVDLVSGTEIGIDLSTESPVRPLFVRQP